MIVSHWKDAETIGLWRWERFSAALMACRHCGRLEVNDGFMNRLSALREAFGEPLLEVSGYRCPEYNNIIASTGRSGPHTTGRAIDINIWGKSLMKLLPLVFEHGFTGIGMSQKGPYQSRFLHLDDLEETDKGPRPWPWTY